MNETFGNWFGQVGFLYPIITIAYHIEDRVKETNLTKLYCAHFHLK